MNDKGNKICKFIDFIFFLFIYKYGILKIIFCIKFNVFKLNRLVNISWFDIYIFIDFDNEIW